MLASAAFLSLLIAGPAPQAWVTRPFNRKDLTGWTVLEDPSKSAWKVGRAAIDPAAPNKLVALSGGTDLVNASEWGQSRDLASTAKWGDVLLTLEVMVPKGSNSGIYLMGEYEVQVLDSFGNDEHPQASDMGALYGAQPPQNPTYRAPGEWNKFEIRFQAPRFDANGKKIANAKFVRVKLNGLTVQRNVEMQGPTPGGVDGKEKATGPLMFQGNHGPVAYRKIWVRKA